MTRWLPLLALAGCTTSVDPVREDMLNYFPFENLNGEWQFLNEDTLVGYRLLGRITNEEVVEGTRRFTVDYTKDCVGDSPDCVEDDLVRSMTWSLQGNQGIHLHRVETEASGERVFEPSLRFIDRYMNRGDATESTAGGSTYTTTLEEFVPVCPVLLEWGQCAKITVASSGGPDQVTGTYYLINDFNIVAADWDDDDVPLWQLSNYVTLE